MVGRQLHKAIAVEHRVCKVLAGHDSSIFQERWGERKCEKKAVELKTCDPDLEE